MLPEKKQNCERTGGGCCSPPSRALMLKTYVTNLYSIDTIDFSFILNFETKWSTICF